MRVELWPNQPGEEHECYFGLDMPNDTLEFLMSQRGGLVTAWSSSTSYVRDGRIRYRIPSPLMLLTICQNHSKERPELKQVVRCLESMCEFVWEIRIPLASLEEEDPEKEEVPV